MCCSRSTRSSRRGSRSPRLSRSSSRRRGRPRSTMIAGSGLVEARRENIPIGVNIPGVVTEVFVKKGEKVKAGAPLFRIDDRDYKAQLAVREAELVSAEGTAPQADRRAPARGHPARPGGGRRGPGQDERRRGRAGPDRAAVPAADDRRQRLRQGPLRLSTPPRRPMPRPRPTSSGSWREAGRKTSKSPGPPSGSPRARSRPSRPTSSG